MQLYIHIKRKIITIVTIQPLHFALEWSATSMPSERAMKRVYRWVHYRNNCQRYIVSADNYGNIFRDLWCAGRLWCLGTDRSSEIIRSWAEWTMDCFAKRRDVRDVYVLSRQPSLSNLISLWQYDSLIGRGYRVF